ncbi:hypothetical protein I315_05319 [Cryptococcus gattii Ru294]|nr:hypothetical protein I315_05319 [Cryptococcus gattii Ru294]
MPVGVGVQMLVGKGLGSFVAYLKHEAIIAYLMEEEVLEVQRQEMRGRFQEDLLVALGPM